MISTGNQHSDVRLNEPISMHRLLANGIDYIDALELHRCAHDAEDWVRACAGLGEIYCERAESAEDQESFVSARDWHQRASACFRLAQVHLPDRDHRKARMYRRLIEHYARAGELCEPPGEHLRIPYRGGAMYGWLLRPSEVPSPPVVVLVGGFDDGREEYHSGAQYLLARGLAVLLVDGPGQGESRLFGGLHLDPDAADAFSVIADRLLADRRLGSAIGIWGNSFGGYSAFRGAAIDRRFAACCISNGTMGSAEILARCPWLIGKLSTMLGTDDPARARAVIEQFTLTTHLLADMTRPLLVLHGAQDRIFPVEAAHTLIEASASTDKQLHNWADGDHGLHNHAHAKNVLIADWFESRLHG